MDNGGTDNGGKDTSDAQIFTIEVDKAHVYHNTLNRLDVDGDGHVVPKDIVAMISYLNGFGTSAVPTDGRPTGPYVDINGDGTAAPND